MSITSNNERVKVNNISGHSLSHRNTLTGSVGTLIPILTEEVVPNTRCHLKTQFSVKLPPLASETFANIDYRIEAFFVPHRLLVNGFTDIACGRNKISGADTHMPVLRIHPTTEQLVTQLANYKWFKPGSLADYLGCRNSLNNAMGEDTYLTALPFLAYHKVYDYWYRNKLVQNEAFRDNPAWSQDIWAKYIRWNSSNYLIDVCSRLNDNSLSSFLGPDNKSIFDLRQRNFDSDYFTTATPSPQLGTANNVSIPVTSSTGTLSISALRSANALQQFAERNNLCGVDDVNFYRAMYGADLSYSVAQHPVLLGSMSTPIYVNGIYQNSPSPASDGTENNPYMSVGTQYGSAYTTGVEVLINNFTAQEFGYIMVLGSLVPRVSYSSGVRRYLAHHISSNNLGGDLANPILQSVGPQPVYESEIVQDTSFTPSNIANRPFGYQMRYAEWISHPDEVHGEFIDGRSLDSFVLQRNLTTASINSNFLEIPLRYLDQIFAVTTDSETSGFAYWVDMLHTWNISSPLASFVVPSLEDPASEHGHEVTIRKNGAPMV